MKIEGKVSIDKGQAILRSGGKRVVLLPYPEGTELPQVQMESMGVALFAYLNDRQARMRGDLERGVLYNARIADPVKKIRDVPLVPEMQDPLQLEMHRYFKRDAEESARRSTGSPTSKEHSSSTPSMCCATESPQSNSRAARAASGSGRTRQR